MRRQKCSEPNGSREFPEFSLLLLFNVDPEHLNFAHFQSIYYLSSCCNCIVHSVHKAWIST
jgi:hypothetical protein